MDVGDGDPLIGSWATLFRRDWRLDDEARSWSHRRRFSEGLWRLEEEEQEKVELAFALELLLYRASFTRRTRGSCCWEG